VWDLPTSRCPSKTQTTTSPPPHRSAQLLNQPAPQLTVPPAPDLWDLSLRRLPPVQLVLSPVPRLDRSKAVDQAVTCPAAVPGRFSDKLTGLLRQAWRMLHTLRRTPASSALHQQQSVAHLPLAECRACWLWTRVSVDQLQAQMLRAHRAWSRDARSTAQGSSTASGNGLHWDQVPRLMASLLSCMQESGAEAPEGGSAQQHSSPPPGSGVGRRRWQGQLNPVCASKLTCYGLFLRQPDYFRRTRHQSSISEALPSNEQSKASWNPVRIEADDRRLRFAPARHALYPVTRNVTSPRRRR
jgi:hypothetical protein